MMYHYPSIFGSLFLLASHSAEAQDANSLLWRIDSPELTESSYVFGTIHMIEEEHFFIDEPVQRAFNDADAAVFEFNMDDSAQLASIAPLIMLPEGMTLQQFISEEEYELLSNYMRDSLGQNIIFFNQMKPIVLQQVFAELNSGEDITSYEFYFLDQCREANKTVRGLETVSDQISVLDSIPYELQMDWVLESLQDQGKSDSMMQELILAYTRQDLKALSAIITASSPEFNEFADLLIYNRNKNWIPVMEDMMQEGSMFFAVGAGHLPGEEGILQLLRSKGYSVTPVLQ